MSSRAESVTRCQAEVKIGPDPSCLNTALYPALFAALSASHMDQCGSHMRKQRDALARWRPESMQSHARSSELDRGLGRLLCSTLAPSV